MPKIVWDKGSDGDHKRKSINRNSVESHRDKFHRGGKNKKPSNPRRDNVNNNVRLQHLENDPHDDMREDAKFTGSKRNSTEQSRGKKKLNKSLLAAFKGLVESNEEQNARKKEVKVKSVASKQESETFPGRRVIEFDEVTKAGCIQNEEDNAETRIKNDRKFYFETSVVNCPSESSCSPNVYEDPPVHWKEDENNWKRYKDSKRKEKKPHKGRERERSPKKKRRKRSSSSSSSSSSASGSDGSTEREEDLKKINRKREKLLKMKEIILSRDSSTSDVGLAPDMEDLLSKEKEKSRLIERSKKRTPITAPDLEPAQDSVKKRLGAIITVRDSPESRRTPEEDRSKTRRDFRERRHLKSKETVRNSKERLSRTPDFERDFKMRRVSNTSENRIKRRNSDHGSRKRTDSERDKDKLLNKVRHLRTNEKKEAVKQQDEGRYIILSHQTFFY